MNKDDQTSTTVEQRPRSISNMQVCKCIRIRLQSRYQRLNLKHTHNNNYTKHTHTHTHTITNINTSTSPQTSTQFPSSACTLSILHYLQTCTRYTTYMYFDMNLQRSCIYCVSLFSYYMGTLLIFRTDLDTYIDLFVPCQNHHNV